MSGNLFKQRLREPAPQLGLWMSLASPLAADAVSRLGYDWLLCDTEHAPLEVSGVLPILQAADRASQVVVRVAWNDKVLIKRHLDLGAKTLLIPFVETTDEARAAVAATRYPPSGVRGVAGLTRASAFGTRPNYLQEANDEICVLVQVETAAALERIDEIAAQEGVDGVFIGPSDLAASLGHIGAPGHPEVQAAIRGGVERLRAVGVPAGILATTEEDAARYLGLGVAFAAVGVDIGLLMGAAKARLAALRKA